MQHARSSVFFERFLFLGLGDESQKTFPTPALWLTHITQEYVQYIYVIFRLLQYGSFLFCDPRAAKFGMRLRQQAVFSFFKNAKSFDVKDYNMRLSSSRERLYIGKLKNLVAYELLFFPVDKRYFMLTVLEGWLFKILKKYECTSAGKVMIRGRNMSEQYKCVWDAEWWTKMMKLILPNIKSNIKECLSKDWY